MQLHQLDSEVLQHAQQKAERFGQRGRKSSRSAHRSEGDPFADAAASGQYDDLPSASEEEDAGNPHLLQSPVSFLCFCHFTYVQL